MEERNSSSTDADVDRLQTDQPIERRGDDDLDRLPLVDLLATEIRQAPTSDGFVMALTGPWGEGKTSVLNLVASAVEPDVVVVRFNPWLFADASALVTRFFIELSTQIGRHQRLRNAGKMLASYGKAVAPLGSLLLGPSADLLAKTLGALNFDNRSADDERESLRNELIAREQRILVLIDDIDRLHDEEIIDVMRLVKLVGDLPFVTYLLAFDRPYVENAVDREQWDGRSYLEKVVQVSYALPAIRESKIQALLLARINSLISTEEYLPPRSERWEEVLARGMMPFFRNLRDVVRFSSGIRSTVRLVGKDVALEDVLGLETLRVFEPKVHQQLPKLVPALTKRRAGLFIDNTEEEKKEKAALDAALDELSPERQSRVRDLLTVLFPRAGEALGRSSYQAEHWRRYRQVADASVLRTYLHASVDPDMASYVLVEETLQALGDAAALKELLDDLSSEVLADLLSQLPAFKDRMDGAVVQSGVLGLMKLEPRLADESEPLKPIPLFYLKNAIRSLLEALPQSADRHAALVQAFEDVEHESERLSLIYWFGTFQTRERKQPDFEILDEDLTEKLQHNLNGRVRTQGSHALRDEPRFFWLINEAYRDSEEGRSELAASLEGNDAVLLSLLHEFVTFSIESNTKIFDGNRAERLFSPAFLLDRVDQLDPSKLTGNDKEMVTLLREALEAEPGDQ